MFRTAFSFSFGRTLSPVSPALSYFQSISNAYSKGQFSYPMSTNHLHRFQFQFQFQPITSSSMKARYNRHHQSFSSTPTPNNNNSSNNNHSIATEIDGDHRMRVAVITGAGVSTLSGIPDYRGRVKDASSLRLLPRSGRPTFHGEFISSERVRRRYWARSAIGYPAVFKARRNDAHARIEDIVVGGNGGYVGEKVRNRSVVITQNVDGLHGSRAIELHGNIHGVRCLDCGATVERRALQAMILEENTAFFDQVGIDTRMLSLAGEEYTEKHAEDQESTIKLRPDGDAEIILHDDNAFEALLAEHEFKTPECKGCGGDGRTSGVMMPTVVFFGGAVSKEVSNAARQAVVDSDIVLVLGTTLAALSAYSLVRLAVEDQTRGRKVFVVNKGITRADNLPGIVKFDTDVSHFLNDYYHALTYHSS